MQGIRGDCLEPSRYSNKFVGLVFTKRFWNQKWNKYHQFVLVLIPTTLRGSTPYQVLASGVHPTTDFEGKPLTGARAKMGGKPIAGGDIVCFFVKHTPSKPSCLHLRQVMLSLPHLLRWASILHWVSRRLEVAAWKHGTIMSLGCSELLSYLHCKRQGKSILKVSWLSSLSIVLLWPKPKL